MKFKIKKDQKKQIRVDNSGNYLVELIGEGAKAEIVGMFIGKGNDQINIDVEVRHMAQNTSANTHIRGVLSGKAKAQVNGLIKVYKGAQQTNSFLTEKVLLLSKTARAEAVPNLEIEADEVKCSHAVTVGKIDEQQLFYLMSRGLNRKVAEKMIVAGFLAPVKELIGELVK